jgi:two-component system, sensor histidine kinase PdtaS
MLKKSLFTFIFLFTSFVFSAQNTNNIIDSLQSLISDLNKQRSSFINDTSRIRTLNILASKLISAGDLAKGDSLASEALLIGKAGLLRSEGGESIGYKNGIAKSYRNRGNANFYQENYNASIDLYSEEVAIYESFLADNGLPETFKKRISSDLAKVLGNIANVYGRQDNYSKALENYYRSLKIHERLNDEKQIGIMCGNIGIVYYRMKEFPKALEFYEKALKIAQKQNSRSDEARHLTNMGMVFSDQKNYEKSLEYFNSALKLAQKEKDFYSQTSILSALGTVYGEIGNYEKAFDFLDQGLRIAEENEDKGMISNLTGNIGGILMRQNRLKEAEVFLLKAVSVAKEIGELYDQKEWSYNLAELYLKQKKTELAFNYYHQYDQIKDSIFSKENSLNILRHEMNYEYEKKEAKEKAEHEKQIIKFQAQQKLDQQMVLFLVIGIVLVLLLLFFVKRAYDAKKKYADVLADEGERKQLLLEEVHHRISNNLSIISSLLSIQMNAVEDDRLNSHLLQTQNRIQSLSALHELLNQTDSQLQININEYIGKILDFHREAASGLYKALKIESKISPVQVPAKAAVPIALIINELITNSLKYAFPEKSSGLIFIELLPSRDKINEWQLIVSDNGKGFSPEIDQDKDSLGLRLVRIMVRQLEGSLEIDSKNGTTVKIIFDLLIA